MSVLSQLGGSIDWPVRWTKWDTRSTRSAWALGPSEALRPGNDGGSSVGGKIVAPIDAETYCKGWMSCRAAERCDYQRDQGNPDAPRLTQLGEVKAAEWQSPKATDAAAGSQSRGGDRRNELLLTGQTKAAEWPTGCAQDAARGPESRETKAALGSGGINQPHAVVVASNWQTPVVADTGQSGSVARGPSMTSQVRAADWFSPQARDFKDTGPTQGNRKSPNLGTQAHADEPGAPGGCTRSG